MAGGSRRRKLIIGVIIVALSLGIVFASLPYLQPPPPPHGSITGSTTQQVSGGSTSSPGYYNLPLQAIPTNQSFYVQVTTNGTAIFCVILDQYFQNWVTLMKSQPTKGSQWFSQLLAACYAQTQTSQTTTLKFYPTQPGPWDILALNTNPSGITVTFSPA